MASISELANMNYTERKALWESYQTAEAEFVHRRTNQWDEVFETYSFKCKRCKRYTHADDGGVDEFPGLCSKCWCIVEPYLSRDQLVLPFPK